MDPPPIAYCRTDDGVDLAYCTLGQGRPALLLHPVAVSHLRLEWRVPSFREVYDLITRDFRLVRYDPRATGLSGLAHDVSVDGFVRDMHTVVAAVGREPAAIIAVVSITPLAIAFASAYPDQVSSLILLCPELDYDRRRGIERALQRHTPANAAERMRRVLNPEVRVENEEAIGAAIAENRRRWATAGLVGVAEAVHRARVGHLLPTIACPTLVVHYPNHAFSDGVNVAARIPNARLVLREGPNAPLLNPDLPELFDTVRDFVLEHAPASRAPTGGGARPLASCGLSARELEVLRYVAAGATNAQIAEALSLSRHTVARHVSNVLRKTGLSNRVALARYAAEHRIGGDAS